MGGTIYVQTNDDGLADGDDYDHSFMLSLQGDLDRIAQDLGVATLSTFFDNTAMEEAFADELGDEFPLSEPNWSDSKEGLASVRALTRVLESNPSALGSRSDATSVERLVEELKHAEKVLKAAVRKKRQFRLLLVP